MEKGERNGEHCENQRVNLGAMEPYWNARLYPSKANIILQACRGVGPLPLLWRPKHPINSVLAGVDDG